MVLILFVVSCDRLEKKVDSFFFMDARQEKYESPVSKFRQTMAKSLAHFNIIFQSRIGKERISNAACHNFRITAVGPESSVGNRRLFGRREQHSGCIPHNF